MTKTELTSSIGTAIAIVISRVKLLLGISKIVDTLYPAEVTDSNTTETYTTKDGVTITYSLSLIKHGNSVHMKISVSNLTGTISLANGDIFDWKDTEYKPITGTSLTFKDSTNTVEFILRANNFGYVGVIPPGTFQTDYKFYIAKD